MIRITALYPNKPGARFDLAYYVEKHCPMVMELLGEACKGSGVDQGIAGVTPQAASSILRREVGGGSGRPSAR